MPKVSPGQTTRLPPDRPAARSRARKNDPPEPRLRQPRPNTRRDKITQIMAGEPGRDWPGRELADRLGVRPRNILTQLAEWTRLGFLTKTGPAGTRSPPSAQPGRNPNVARTG